MFGRNKQQPVEADVQATYYFDEPPMTEVATPTDEVLAPYVDMVPLHERQADGRIYRVHWPEGSASDVNLEELATIKNMSVRELAESMGYTEPASSRRLQELADARAGIVSPQDGGHTGGPSNEIKMSFDKLHIEGFKFEGDPASLFGGRAAAPQQPSALEQAVLSYIVQRAGQPQVQYDEGADYSMAATRRTYWDQPLIEQGAPERDYEDAEEVVETEQAEWDNSVAHDWSDDEASTGLSPVHEEPQQSHELDQSAIEDAAQLAKTERAAKIKKLRSRIGTLAAVATITVGGYGSGSYVLGLGEHNIVKADIIQDQQTFWKFVGVGK